MSVMEELNYVPTTKSKHGTKGNAYYVFYRGTDIGLVRNSEDGWIAAYQWIYFSKEKFPKRDAAGEWLLSEYKKESVSA